MPQPISERFAQISARVSTPDQMLSRLIEFEPQALPVISMYLDARTNQHGKRDFAPFVRKRMIELARIYAPHSQERAGFVSDAEQIERYLKEWVDPATQGIAIFACDSKNKFFDVGEFNVPFPRNRISVSDRPHLYPLARLAGKNPRYAVVVADANNAHIFVFGCGRTMARADVQNSAPPPTEIRRWMESRYQRHMENYQLHHMKEIANVLERTLRDDGVPNLILAGDEKTIIPMLREQLSKKTKAKIIDVLSLPVATPESELLAESLKAFQKFDSKSERAKVQRLMNEYRADDLAVAGVAQTLAAASNGQVDEMLITSSPADLVYDEVEVANVLQLYPVDNQLSPKLDQRSVADELVRRATQLSSARVTFIENATQLNQVGGVGALLRYRISPHHAAPYEEGAAVARTEALVAA
jgi:peptide subunit release factor 1 (eRF1)